MKFILHNVLVGIQMLSLILDKQRNQILIY